MSADEEEVKLLLGSEETSGHQHSEEADPAPVHAAKDDTGDVSYSEWKKEQKSKKKKKKKTEGADQQVSQIVVAKSSKGTDATKQTDFQVMWT